MTNSFWKWLSGLDARRIFIVLLLFFILHLGSTLKFGLTNRTVSIATESDNGFTNRFSRVTKDLRIAPAMVEVSDNPFSSPFLDNAMEIRREFGEFLGRTIPAGAAAENAGGQDNAQSDSPADTPHPDRELTYRGMMRRTDGVDIAFIDNQTTGVRSHYLKGDTISCYTVLEISRRAVVLTDEKQHRYTLPVDLARKVQDEEP